MEARVLDGEKPFAEAEEKFGKLLARLKAPATQRLEHSKVECVLPVRMLGVSSDVAGGAREEFCLAWSRRRRRFRTEIARVPPEAEGCREQRRSSTASSRAVRPWSGQRIAWP
jgi:hypothetical protein